jgi:O-antigen/teichoic acid export membrane protein
MFKLLNSLRRWGGVDRPVFFAGLGQAWSLFSGPITIFLITRYFTPKTQGYYYTFGGVAALGVFLELGFSQCIVQFASHEFARLRFRPGGVIEGDPLARSRLISLGRLSLKWYGVIAILAFIGLGLGGHWFFWAKHDSTVSWVLPWWSLCLAAGFSLLLLPVTSLLEGCNQMAFVYGLRTLSRVVSAVVLWVAVWGGANLFTGALMLWATAFVMAVAYLWRWRGLLGEFWHASKGEAISWRHEIWPLQWRIAVSWASSYFTYSFFTPVLFYFHGPLLAGQMGATMSLVNSLNALAAAWTVSKGPRFGMLINQRQFGELDRLFYKATTQAVGICIMGGLALLAGLVFVRAHFALGARFLEPGSTSLLVLATVVNQVIFSQAIYLQAHKQAPFMVLSVVNGLTTGLLVSGLGYLLGAWGVSLAYALVQVAMLVWASVVWGRCRKQWHQTDAFEPSIRGNPN